MRKKDKEKLTSRQRHFIAFIRKIYTVCEIQINVQNGEPASWWIAYPHYKIGYFDSENIVGNPLSERERWILNEIKEMEFGRMVITASKGMVGDIAEGWRQYKPKPDEKKKGKKTS